MASFALKRLRVFDNFIAARDNRSFALTYEVLKVFITFLQEPSGNVKLCFESKKVDSLVVKLYS